MKYAINDTTLIAIGDALRRRHGETKPGMVQIFHETIEVNKSPSAINYSNVEMERVINFDRYETTTIPGATKIEVDIAFNQSYYGHDNYCWHIYIAGGSHSEPFETDIDICGRNNGAEGLSTKLFTFENTDTITIRHLQTPKTEYPTSACSGYYAKIKGYDAEGNLIGTYEEVPGLVKNGYLPSEMADAIDAISAEEPACEGVRF